MRDVADITAGYELVLHEDISTVWGFELPLKHISTELRPSLKNCGIASGPTHSRRTC